MSGPLSQREIAAKMHVTEQTTGRILRGLQEQGYITREPHVRDRRRRVVTITEPGRRALTELDDAQSVEALIGQALDPEDVAVLRRLLIDMVTALPLPHPLAALPQRRLLNSCHQSPCGRRLWLVPPTGPLRSRV